VFSCCDFQGKENQSSNHFEEIRQFLAGIEIDPIAGRVKIGQATVSFALDPYQVRVNWKLPAGLDAFKVKFDTVHHLERGHINTFAGPMPAAAASQQLNCLVQKCSHALIFRARTIAGHFISHLKILRILPVKGLKSIQRLTANRTFCRQWVQTSITASSWDVLSNCAASRKQTLRGYASVNQPWYDAPESLIRLAIDSVAINKESDSAEFLL